MSLAGKCLSLTQAAKAVGMSKYRFRSLVVVGRVPTHRIDGGAPFFFAAELQDWIASTRVDGQASDAVSADVDARVRALMEPGSVNPFL